MKPIALLAIIVLTLAACVGPPLVTPEGCLLVQASAPDSPHKVYLGPCVGGSVLARYKSADGVWLEAAYSESSGEWRFRYQAPDGSWVSYDSKSGLLDFGPLVEAIESSTTEP